MTKLILLLYILPVFIVYITIVISTYRGDSISSIKHNEMDNLDITLLCMSILLPLVNILVLIFFIIHAIIYIKNNSIQWLYLFFPTNDK